MLREPTTWLTMRGITRNNLDHLDIDIPVGVLTSVTGVSGSGKSSLVSQALVELVGNALGHEQVSESDDDLDDVIQPTGGAITDLAGRRVRSAARGCALPRPHHASDDAPTDDRHAYRRVRSLPGFSCRS